MCCSSSCFMFAFPAVTVRPCQSMLLLFLDYHYIFGFLFFQFLFLTHVSVYFYSELGDTGCTPLFAWLGQSIYPIVQLSHIYYECAGVAIASQLRSSGSLEFSSFCCKLLVCHENKVCLRPFYAIVQLHN